MFELDYRIVNSDYDDFVGQNGFFQIKCNGYDYGYIYPKEMEEFMNKVSIYDWLERLTRVIKTLMTRDYVVLSDVESYNTWIEFQKNDKEVIISIVRADKEEGSNDIEYNLINAVDGKWGHQAIDFEQFRMVVLSKVEEYVKFIIENNELNPYIKKLIKELT